jgi:hypothetical protein
VGNVIAEISASRPPQHKHHVILLILECKEYPIVTKYGAFPFPGPRIFRHFMYVQAPFALAVRLTPVMYHIISPPQATGAIVIYDVIGRVIVTVKAVEIGIATIPILYARRTAHNIRIIHAMILLPSFAIMTPEETLIPPLMPPVLYTLYRSPYHDHLNKNNARSDSRANSTSPNAISSRHIVKSSAA